MEYAKSQGFILITRDRGFGNLQEYEITNIGILIIRDLNLSATEIVNIFEAAWAELEADQLGGALVIIDRNKVRIRR